MYDLIIDKRTVRSEEITKPLIEELDNIARSDGFKVATIKWRDSETTDCGHATYGKAGGKWRCAMMTCENYYMKHWTMGK
jgi:hypothetical protein